MMSVILKILVILWSLVCLALCIFGIGVFLAWVFGGMYINDELFLRSFFGVSMGGLGLFVGFMIWLEVSE